MGQLVVTSQVSVVTVQPEKHHLGAGGAPQVSGYSSCAPITTLW